MEDVTINGAGNSVIINYLGRSVTIPLLGIRILDVFPLSGKTGDTIRIIGVGLTGASAVSFGGTAAASYTVQSDTLIEAVVGGGADGNVLVTVPILGSDTFPGFDYIPSGPTVRKLRTSFILDKPAIVATGLYKAGKMVRVFDNPGILKSGTQTKTYSAMTDDLELVDDITGMTVKVLDHNVQYTYTSGIGNTSDLDSGTTIHKAIQSIVAGVITGNRMYISYGGSEGEPTSAYVDLSDIGKKVIIGQVGQVSLHTNHMATDGVNVYWAGVDGWADKQLSKSRSLVFGTNAGTAVYTTFSTGVAVKLGLGQTYMSAISLVEDVKGSILPAVTGLAVQKTGKYLFIAYGNKNEVRVLDKVSGALIRTLAFTTPHGLTVDKADKLWITSGVNVLRRYPVNADGTFGTSDLAITGLSNPLSISASPYADTITVNDSTDQVKAFNSLTGTSLWTLGSGSYGTSSTVADDKFYFSDPVSGYRYNTFTAFHPDGSFWVGDVLNSRTLHFSPGRTYLQQIAVVPLIYTTAIDQNDPTRLFAGFKEFRLDYSKEFRPGNGSWRLVANWGYSLPKKYTNQYTNLLTVHTAVNGKTYGQVFQENTPATNFLETVELVANSILRVTGQIYPVMSRIYPDGSVRRFEESGGTVKWYSRPRTGFTAGPNPVPVMGAEVLVLQSVTLTPRDTDYNGAIYKLSPGEVTSSGLHIINSPERPAETLRGMYHLMAVSPDGQIVWRQRMGTGQRYIGPFPGPYVYDEGNTNPGQNGYRESRVIVIGRFIIIIYHGEFWKQSQTTKIILFDETGLCIGQYGKTGKDDESYGPPEVSGNAFSPSATMVGEDIWIYLNDENRLNKLHAIKLSNLSSVRVQEVPVTLVDTPLGSTVYMMAGVPKDASLSNGDGGWEMFPAPVSSSGVLWKVESNRMYFDPQSTNDMRLEFYGVPVAYHQYRVPDVQKQSWVFSGQVCFDQTYYPALSAPRDETGPGGLFFHIKDGAGKIILRFFIQRDTLTSLTANVWVNNTNIGTLPMLDMDKITRLWQDLSVQMVDGKLIAQYASFPVTTVDAFDKTADITRPRTFGHDMWYKTPAFNPRRVVAYRDWGFD